MLLSRWRPVLAWLPIETVIHDRQKDYYATLARSNAVGTCEEFVAFMLTVIRQPLTPYAMPSAQTMEDSREERALKFFSKNPTATVADLADLLDCSRRTAERVVADLRASGRLRREGSARAGSWQVTDAD